MSQVRGPHRLSRREILRRGGLGLAAIGVAPALLAACGGDDDGDDDERCGGGHDERPRHQRTGDERGRHQRCGEQRRGEQRRGHHGRDRRGHAHRRERHGGRDDRLHLLGGLRRPRRHEGLEGGERRRAEGDVHLDARRHPGQADRRRGRGRLGPHRVLPGLQAAVPRARHPGAARSRAGAEHGQRLRLLQGRQRQLLGGGRTGRARASRGTTAPSASPGTTPSCPAA